MKEVKQWLSDAGPQAAQGTDPWGERAWPPWARSVHPREGPGHTPLGFLSWQETSDFRESKKANAGGPETQRGGKSTDTQSRDLQGSPSSPLLVLTCAPAVQRRTPPRPALGGGRGRQCTPRSPVRPQRACVLPCPNRPWDPQATCIRKGEAMPWGERKGCQAEGWMHMRGKEAPQEGKHVGRCKRRLFLILRIPLKQKLGLPWCSVVKKPPADAGDMGLMPDPGRSYMPWSHWDHVQQLLSLCSGAWVLQLLSPCTATTEARTPQSLRSIIREATSTRSLRTKTGE